jgi:hypothetical protein
LLLFITRSSFSKNIPGAFSASDAKIVKQNESYIICRDVDSTTEVTEILLVSVVNLLNTWSLTPDDDYICVHRLILHEIINIYVTYTYVCLSWITLLRITCIRYCTDRYPKAESYGTCNWCLRADEGAASTSSNSPRSASKVTTGGRPAAAHGDTTGRSLKVAARGDFASSILNSKPIKKQHQLQRLVLRRSASDLGSRVVRADHNAPPSPGVARERPRVRRYKLLEEVIAS